MGPLNTKSTYEHVRQPLVIIQKHHFPISEPATQTETLLMTHLTNITSSPTAIVSDGSWRLTGTIRQQVFNINPIYRAGAVVAIIESTKANVTNTILNITGLNGTESKSAISTEMLAIYLAAITRSKLHPYRLLSSHQSI
jgi:hypothetical protein